MMPRKTVGPSRGET